MTRQREFGSTSQETWIKDEASEWSLMSTSSRESSYDQKSFTWESLLSTTWFTTNLNLIRMQRRHNRIPKSRENTHNSSMMDWSNIMFDLCCWITKSSTFDVTCSCTRILRLYCITLGIWDFALKTTLKKTLKTKLTWWSIWPTTVSRTNILTTRPIKTWPFQAGIWLRKLSERKRPNSCRIRSKEFCWRLLQQQRENWSPRKELMNCWVAMLSSIKTANPTCWKWTRILPCSLTQKFKRKCCQSWPKTLWMWHWGSLKPKTLNTMPKTAKSTDMSCYTVKRRDTISIWKTKISWNLSKAKMSQNSKWMGWLWDRQSRFANKSALMRFNHDKL